MATFSRVGFRRETSSLSFSVPGSSRSVLQLYDHRQACKCTVHILPDSWNIFQVILPDTEKIGHNLNMKSFFFSRLVMSIIAYYFSNCYIIIINILISSGQRRKIKFPSICGIKKNIYI